MITITKCGNDLLSEISIWSIYLKCARLYKMTTTPIFEFSRIIPIYYIYKFRSLSPSGGEMATTLGRMWLRTVSGNCLGWTSSLESFGMDLLGWICVRIISSVPRVFSDESRRPLRYLAPPSDMNSTKYELCNLWYNAIKIIWFITF